MLDFDAGKLLIIGLVALVVIGPKDLPRVLRQVGQAVGKLRRMAGEFQGQFMDAMKEADLQDIKAELAKIQDTATLDVDFNPVRDVKAEVTSALAEPPAADLPVVTATHHGGVSGFELPAAADLELAHARSETMVVSGDGAVAELDPLPPRPSDLVPASETSAEQEADARPERETGLPRPDPVQPERDVAAPTFRRRIVVTRRRRLSRLDGPTLRAAVLAGHSRNIRPARRDTTEP